MPSDNLPTNNLAKIPKHKSTIQFDSDVYRLVDCFSWAFSINMKYLRVMEELQQIFDNEVNPQTWPTISKVPIPLLWNSVDRAIPEVFDALFPVQVNLTPTDDEDTDMASVEKSEWLLHRILNNEMNLTYKCLPTIRDMFKLGLGLGIVEPCVIHPPATAIRVLRSGDMSARTRQIAAGRPVPSVRFKYVSPGQVAVTPDGSEFNGENRVSAAFYVDSYSEDEIRRMFKEQPEGGGLKGNPEHLIQRARENGFDSRIPIVDVIAQLAGLPLRGVQQVDPNLPVRVPVIKCYEEMKHTWIANGEEVMYSLEAKDQPLRCPLVKACPWNDGVRFYPSSPASVTRHIVKGYNYFVGCILDLLSQYWNPPLLYDRTRFPEGAPKRGPNEDWAAIGDIDKAARYMDSGNIPDAVMSVGNLMKTLHGESVNQPEFMNAGTPGLVRAGAGAFGDLTRQVSIRDSLNNLILETGFVRNIIENTIMVAQTTLPEKGRRMRRRTVKKGQVVLENMQVTPDDFVRAFEFTIDTRAAFLRTSEGMNLSNGYFAAMKDDPYADQFAIRMEQAKIIYGEERARTILPLSKEEAAAVQQRQQGLVEQERARRLAGKQAEGGGSGLSVESGAVLGGANGGNQ